MQCNLVCKLIFIFFNAFHSFHSFSHTKESLLLNNNELCSLPDELCRLHALEVLDVRENNLESLPTELHSIVSHFDVHVESTMHSNDVSIVCILVLVSSYIFIFFLQKCLKKLQCGGNDRMSIIPELMRDDSALVLWTLKLHHIFKDQIKHLKAEYSTIERQTKNIHGMRLLREEENKRLFNEVKELERDRPVVYIRRKESFIKFIKKCKARMQKFRNRMKISYG